MSIKGLQFSDIDQIIAIQKAVYTDKQLIEDRTAFISKIDIFPEGALGYVDDGGLVAYLFCHPWRTERVVSLDEELKVLPKVPNCFYLHDLSVLPNYGGQGIGTKLARRAIKIGINSGFFRFELVAVQNSTEFWTRFGFKSTQHFEYVPGINATKMMLDMSSN